MTNETTTTREKLLAAGAQQLLNHGLGVLQRGLKIDDIVRDAHTTDKTLYATFGDKPNFVDELLLSLNDAPHRVAYDLTEKVQDVLIENGGDPRKTVRAICEWDFEQVSKDPSTLLQLAVLVLARDHHKAMDKLRRAYATYDDAGRRAYEAILARWGASMRKPFTPETTAVVLTALVEGLSIRKLADPDAVPSDLFGNTVIALIGSIVDTAQHHEHIDDVIAPLADEVMVMYEAAQPDGWPDDPRIAVVEAARAEFGARGYFATTLLQISVRAGVPLPALKNLFSSKALIVVSALRAHVEELRRQTSDDQALKLSLPDVLARFLRRLATFARDNEEFVEAMLAVIAHDTSASPDTAVHVKRDLDIPGIIEPVLRAGQKAGIITDSLTAYDAAAMTVNTLLLRCFTRRGEGPDQHAAVVQATLYSGLLARLESPNGTTTHSKG